MAQKQTSTNDVSVSVKSIAELLSLNLYIPEYQRDYSWSEDHARQLFEDTYEVFKKIKETNQKYYLLGSVILHKEIQKHEKIYNIVDGQQRTITLRVLTNLLEEKIIINEDDYENDSPLAKVIIELKDLIKNLKAEEKKQYNKFIKNKCNIVQIVTQDQDLAFRFFDSQNHRGKPLEPHDLLKAHHLREMSGLSEIERTAIIHRWESARTQDLKDIFEKYLYRIKLWSQGKQAEQNFKKNDLYLFKGITSSQKSYPSSIYHILAQQATSFIPMWETWQNGASISSNTRDSKFSSAQFQINQPIIAGKYFFDFTAFIHDEISQIKKMCQEDGIIEKDRKYPFNNKKYLSSFDLYISALLIYINKFGNDDLDRAKKCYLFGHSYQDLHTIP